MGGWPHIYIMVVYLLVEYNMDSNGIMYLTNGGKILVGGIPTLPLWKIMDFVSWDDEFPISEWKVIKIHGSKPPASIYNI